MRIDSDSRLVSPIPLPEQFSAEVVRSDGEITKVFIDGARRRIESDENGKHKTVITRPDLGVIYILFDHDSSYLECPLPDSPSSLLNNPEQSDKWQLVGQEIIEGRSCHKFVVFRETRPGQPSAFCYVDIDTSMRVRFTTVNRIGEPVVTIEYKNIRLGKPDAKLFDVPATFRHRNL